MSPKTVLHPELSALARANPLARMAGRDAAVWTVLAEAGARFSPALLCIDAAAAPPDAAGDYAQIDARLALADIPAAGTPAPGVGYSGLTPAQRRAFLAWLHTPDAPAPRAFQWLYLANLEVRLLEPAPMPLLARTELLRLAAAPAWDARLVAPRLLLAWWLAQDGAGLAQWLAGPSPLDGEMLDCALGMLARLKQPLPAALLPALAAAWQLPAAAASTTVLELRLNSLASTLGGDLLQHALGPAAEAPVMTPWRCLHRDLHLALPQGTVRNALTPPLVELLTQSAQVELPVTADAAEAPEPAGKHALDKAHLIVEFSESRSTYFASALRRAKKQPGFQQLMDEDRQIVYRAPFRRSEMRRFWELWQFVQGWSSTRVYYKGQELDKRYVYNGSSFLY